MSNPYRDYYLASEKNFALGGEVGVGRDEWSEAQREYEAAIEACEKCEETKGVTVTISRELARELAYDWKPLDDDDPMIELFEACRSELDETE